MKYVWENLSGRGVEANRGIWYNKRGMTAFHTVAMEPRFEFAAKGRQTPKEDSVRGTMSVHNSFLYRSDGATLRVCRQGASNSEGRLYSCYNERGITAFYIVAMEPRFEFAAKGRQTPKEDSVRVTMSVA